SGTTDELGRKCQQDNCSKWSYSSVSIDGAERWYCYHCERALNLPSRPIEPIRGEAWNGYDESESRMERSERISAEAELRHNTENPHDVGGFGFH
ncbi:unnamed protein product, partial [marine sediment metagenome]